MECQRYLNPKKGGRFWQLRRQGGVLCARREIMVIEAVNFDPTSTISISYESCDVFLSFDTLVSSLSLLVWPQKVAKLTDCNVREIHSRKF